MDYNDEILKMIEILSSHGIKMSASGCGCCGSPNIRFQYKGEDIVCAVEDGEPGPEPQVNFDMFDEVG